MRKFAKLFVCIFVISFLLSIYTQNAYACNKSPDCYAKGFTIICKDVHGMVITHPVTNEDGKIVSCLMNIVYGLHEIRCSGCGKLFYTDIRICSEDHSDPHSDLKIGLCKYEE